MKPANNAPIYACVYAGFAEIAREHGYALAVHGSLASDFDMVCVPWVTKAADPEAVVAAILAKYAIHRCDGDPEIKHHGRIAYTLYFKFGDVRLDLSFMPRSPALVGRPRYLCFEPGCPGEHISKRDICQREERPSGGEIT